MKTVFLRVLTDYDKEQALLQAIRQPGRARGRRLFEVNTEEFACVPRSPFSYWTNGTLRELFTDLPAFEGEQRFARGGIMAQSDERFLRTSWEPTYHDIGESEIWVPLCKGGAFAPYYADVHLLIDWKDGGQHPRAAYDVRAQGASWGGFGRNEEFYFRPGLTWPLRTDGLSFRVMPTGCIFGHKGPAAFVAENNSVELLALLAVINSSVFGALVALQLARTELAQSYEVGIIQHTPVPILAADARAALAALARCGWSLRRSLDTHTETSHAFVLPSLLRVLGDTLAARAEAWAERVEAVEVELATVQADLDVRCFDLYGIDEGGRRAITGGVGAAASESASEVDAESELEPDDEPDAEAGSALGDTTNLVTELLSWSVGVAFGRFDVRLATGERAGPLEPDPFDPLPVCSPGMLTGDDGLPLAVPPVGYPLVFPADGLLLDDSGHPRDLTSAVRAVFEVVFGADADARWSEAAGLLDPKGHDLRAWLSNSFFEHHLKRYSKSRRKAPILWQLATPSGRYSIWLYVHRATSDTFFHARNEILAPKLTHEERKLAGLVADGGPNPSSVARKEIDRQETFVRELRALRDDVARIAPLWNPDLNDGVILTMAPLWRLAQQHRAWQKELRSAWDALASGMYDWAHLAMHLWPERVVPKCAADRSLAIAHGLDEVFWEEDANGEWVAREIPVSKIAELVAERTLPAVKAALNDLLVAPAIGVTQGGRRGRPNG